MLALVINRAYLVSEKGKLIVRNRSANGAYIVRVVAPLLTPDCYNLDEGGADGFNVVAPSLTPDCYNRSRQNPRPA